MSLHVYMNRADIPESIEFVDYNDIFFNGTVLCDNELNRIIMKEIDRAEYYTEETFIGRDRELGALNKEHLSTGCKTLLNIVNNKDTCFDVIECGQNVLSMLPRIHEGHILWNNPVLHYTGKQQVCDIMVGDKKFVSFIEFLRYIMED